MREGGHELDDEDYSRERARLTEITARELESARGDPVSIRRACARYFRRGWEAGLDHGALIDFLGVSSPSVFDEAGYTDQETIQAMEMLADLTAEEIERSLG